MLDQRTRCSYTARIVPFDAASTRCFGALAARLTGVGDICPSASMPQHDSTRLTLGTVSQGKANG